MSSFSHASLFKKSIRFRDTQECHVEEMRCSHTVDYYLAVKRKGVVVHVPT